MASNRFCLFTIGDPIRDVWSYGWEDDSGKWNSRFTEERAGGASNTSMNVAAISKDFSYANWGCLPHVPYQLLRLEYPESQDNRTLKLWNYFGNLKEMYRFPGGTALFSRFCFRDDQKGLVISDYNKGTVNRLTKRDLPVFEFAVVDSKYKSLHMSWLRTSKVKIWHATGSEYNQEWAENFDYVIWTNGPHTVNVSGGLNDKGYRIHKHVPVPDTKVVDTIGAGDTFTAAIGVWLSYVKEDISTDDITFDDVCNATRFAIWCCQDVITKKYTAVCTRTLKQYLEE